MLAPGADPSVVPGKVYDLIGRQRGSETQQSADRWGGFLLQRLTGIGVGPTSQYVPRNT